MPAARNIRAVLALALEGLAGDPFEWAIVNGDSLRDHITRWVKSYGAARGVVFEDKDIADEIDALANSLRDGVKPSSLPNEELP